MAKKKQIRFIDFCAGIGGGRLGLERGINASCVGFSEIMPTSEKTYRILHKTNKERNWGDLTKINAKELPDFEILIAGFPCQTFSIIGQRKGFKDKRGQIIYHLIRILKDKNVPYFILENVKGLINHNRGNTIKTIKKSLEYAGFHTDYKLINSVKMGVPQIRERVYFIGIRKDQVKRNEFIWPNEIDTPDIKNFLCDNNSEVLDENNATFQRYLNNKYNNGKYNIKKLLKEDYLVIDTRQSDLRQYRGVVPTLRTGRHGILYVKNGKFHKLSGFESLLLQGFKEKSSIKVSKEKNVLERNLLSQAGNAMTVNAIELLSKQLLNYIEK
ncbi:MAG: DNA (cytosine-5-)-methyltransferase [Bifidobacteriaceae bacterium]|jgi:DNA (cytosine-5)-methyltransferase 1|nr:DNA (cytosine-5-)-methyltransferase [Bifidobacteriaceae bacterium]